MFGTRKVSPTERQNPGIRSVTASHARLAVWSNSSKYRIGAAQAGYTLRQNST
jgi:hypothetical protein